MTAGNHTLCTATKVTGAAHWSRCSLLETSTVQTACDCSSTPSLPGSINYSPTSTSTVSGAEAHSSSPLPCSGEHHKCTDRAAGSSDSGCLCENLWQNLVCLITQRKNSGKSQTKPVTHVFPFPSVVQQMHSATERCLSALAQSTAHTMPQAPGIYRQSSNPIV